MLQGAERRAQRAQQSLLPQGAEWRNELLAAVPRDAGFASPDRHASGKPVLAVVRPACLALAGFVGYLVTSALRRFVVDRRRSLSAGTACPFQQFDRL